MVTLRLSTDAVATTASLLPETVLPPVKPAVMGTGVVGVVLVVPDVPLVGATLLLMVLDPQPEISVAATAPRSSERKMGNISRARYARAHDAAANCVTQ
jgi:hypothetical protein